LQYVPPKKDRDKALQRALKFAVLFQESTFDEILAVLNSPTFDPNTTTRPTAFDTACNGANINNEDEKAWLWNYLKHMNEPKSTEKKFWNDVPDLYASTGW
jgi:hypothetical protein